MKPTAFLFSAFLALCVVAPAQEAETVQDTAQESTITVNFKNQDLAAVLEMFSTEYGMNLVYGPDLTGEVTMNLFDAPVNDALRRILSANGYAMVQEGGFLLIIEENAAQNEDGVTTASPFEPMVIHLNHVRAKDVVPMVQPMLNGNEMVVPGSESESGLDVEDDLGGNGNANREFFILYADEATQKRVTSLLKKIDLAPAQVLVEATILSVSISDEFKLGVDFTALGGVDFQALSGTSNLTDSGSDSNPDGKGLGEWFFGAGTSGFSNGSSDGLHVGILRNQVGVFVEALEKVGNASVLSNPQVLTVNRHAAEILVGKKLPYLTATSTDTVAMQNVEFLDVGTSLVFRPFIGDDGMVRMEIHPKSSSGLINAQGLPEETTTEVKTNVLVRSGHTVVIGGLMENSITTDVSQIPFLGSIPGIGSLFRSESQTERKTEIIILLTPHVLQNDALEQRSKDAADRLRLSQAQLASSHHGYLRPSYARQMYAEAAQALASGRPGVALAKAEWGLSAMPSDPDLALMQKHCQQEVSSLRLEEEELRDALSLIESQNTNR